MEGAERARKLLQSLPLNDEEHRNGELEGWRARTLTFTMERWGVLPDVPGLVAALYGWSCADMDKMQCDDCGSSVAAARAASSLQTGHKASCPWRAHRVDPHAALCPGVSTLVARMHERLASLPAEVSVAVPDDLAGLGDALGTSSGRAVAAVCGW